MAGHIELFNDGLTGRIFELKWEARWDAPTGELFRKGRIGAIEIEPGFHTIRTVEFTLPPKLRRKRTLHLVLESVKEGKTVSRRAEIFT